MRAGVASQAVLEIALLCADLLAAAGGCTEAAVGLPAGELSPLLQATIQLGCWHTNGTPAWQADFILQQ